MLVGMGRQRALVVLMLAGTLGVVGLMTSSSAHGDEKVIERGPITAVTAPGAGSSRSVGWVYRGHLEDGEFLEASVNVHHVERFAEHGRFFGTSALVGLLERAATQVTELHGAARLNVGELSQEGGGDVVGHRSHENGRDVDVGFYLLDDDGNSVEPERFVRIGGSGRGGDGEQRVTFDTARNWAFIEALVTDETSPVQMIFVSRSIRRRLVRWARAEGVAPEIVERAEWTLIPPEGVARHDDHFHVRIYCEPGEHEACHDRGPYWQWIPESHVPQEAELLPRYWPHE